MKLSNSNDDDKSSVSSGPSVFVDEPKVAVASSSVANVNKKKNTNKNTNGISTEHQKPRHRRRSRDSKTKKKKKSANQTSIVTATSTTDEDTIENDIGIERTSKKRSPKKRKTNRQTNSRRSSSRSSSPSSGSSSSSSNDDSISELPGAHAVGGRQQQQNNVDDNLENEEEEKEEELEAHDEEEAAGGITETFTVDAQLVQEDEERLQLAQEIEDEIYRNAIVGEAVNIQSNKRNRILFCGCFSFILIGTIVGLTVGLNKKNSGPDIVLKTTAPTKSLQPSSLPSSNPTITPIPTSNPTNTQNPTNIPSMVPSEQPSSIPSTSIQPSSNPTSVDHAQRSLILNGPALQNLGQYEVSFGNCVFHARQCLFEMCYDVCTSGWYIDFFYKEKVSSYVTAILCNYNLLVDMEIAVDLREPQFPKKMVGDYCHIESFYAGKAGDTYTVHPGLAGNNCCEDDSCDRYDADCVNETASIISMSNFTIQLVDNDECLYAHPLGDARSAVVTETYTTANAFPDNSLFGEEQKCGGLPIGTTPGVWYQVVGTGGVIIASTCSETTDFDTQLSVFRGDNCNELECITSNNDFCGEQSQVQWPSHLGQQYYILVNGADISSKGIFELEVFSENNRVSNDFCHNAMEYEDDEVTISFLGSTPDAELPSCINGWYGDVGWGYDYDNANTVWYSYTATTNSNIGIFAEWRNWDIECQYHSGPDVRVYHGSCGNPKCSMLHWYFFLSNDSRCNSQCLNCKYIQVQFLARIGETYYIAVSSKFFTDNPDATMLINSNNDVVEGDSCETARILPINCLGYIHGDPSDDYDYDYVYDACDDGQVQHFLTFETPIVQDSSNLPNCRDESFGDILGSVHSSVWFKIAGVSQDKYIALELLYPCPTSLEPSIHFALYQGEDCNDLVCRSDIVNKSQECLEEDVEEDRKRCHCKHRYEIASEPGRKYFVSLSSQDEMEVYLVQKVESGNLVIT